MKSDPGGGAMVFRFIADQNFNEEIIRGWRRRGMKIDLVLARHFGLQRVNDADLLAWAADSDRILLTHDRNTMCGFANDRVVKGMPMPDVLVIDDQAAIGIVLDDLQLVVEASSPSEWSDQVRFLPF